MGQAESHAARQAREEKTACMFLQFHLCFTSVCLPLSILTYMLPCARADEAEPHPRLPDIYKEDVSGAGQAMCTTSSLAAGCASLSVIFGAFAMFCGNGRCCYIMPSVIAVLTMISTALLHVLSFYSLMWWPFWSICAFLTFGEVLRNIQVIGISLGRDDLPN